ncbi:MAG: aldo/keto reductase [Chloroflexi bacterium]|nr:aldo/keto reductase [Chloroflexota bacterium]
MSWAFRRNWKSMKLRRLGVTGLPVSVLGFGCGAIGGLLTRGNPQEQRDAIATAIGAGINYFDTAPLYGNGASESNLGRVFAEMGGVPGGVVIGTKVRIEPAQAKDAPATIRSSMEDSLTRLRMDRVDLLQLHTSITEHSGRGVTVSDVLGPIMDGLEAVRDAGLASWVGITANGDTEAVREVVRSGRTATAQIRRT